MVGCHIHGGSIAILGKPARQAFAGVPVGFVDGIAFRLDLHFSVRGRRLVRSSRAAARLVAVFVNRDLYIRVVSCQGRQGNRDGPAFHCNRDHTWRLSLAAALGIYLCDVAPATDSGRDCIRSGKAIVRVVSASAHLRGLGLVINCGRILCRSHERLDYAKLSGEVVRPELPALAGLSIPGPWIPQFEQLVHFTEREVPWQEGLLMIPGEDLFYYATGRRPRFPVLVFDHTGNPYDPAEIS